MNSDLMIRRYEEKDLDALYEMIKKAFLTPALDKVYEKEVKDFWLSEYTKENLTALAQERHLYVALYHDGIIGSAAIGYEEGEAYVSAVFIDPFIQGKGIGKALMETIEKDEIALKHKKLTLTASLSAGKFYQKLGYTFKYEIPEIILDGPLDVVYMEKILK